MWVPALFVAIAVTTGCAEIDETAQNVKEENKQQEVQHQKKPEEKQEKTEEKSTEKSSESAQKSEEKQELTEEEKQELKEYYADIVDIEKRSGKKYDLVAQYMSDGNLTSLVETLPEAKEDLHNAEVSIDASRIPDVNIIEEDRATLKESKKHLISALQQKQEMLDNINYYLQTNTDVSSKIQKNVESYQEHFLSASVGFATVLLNYDIEL